MLAACATFIGASAQSLTVCDGTTTNNSVPIQGVMHDTQGVESLMVYPADMLTEMDGTKIMSVTFYANAEVPAAVAGGDKQLFVGEIDATVVSNVRADIEAYKEAATVVWNGEIPTGTDAVTFEFATPYVYNGGNLMLDIYVNEPGGAGATNWYGVSTDTYGTCVSTRAATGNGTKRNFLPKATFNYEATATAVRDIKSDNVVSRQYYDLQGRQVNADYQGIAICRALNADGTVTATKVVR